jgi:predicted transcriptional regulator
MDFQEVQDRSRLKIILSILSILSKKLNLSKNNAPQQHVQ